MWVLGAVAVTDRKIVVSQRDVKPPPAPELKTYLTSFNKPRICSMLTDT